MTRESVSAKIESLITEALAAINIELIEVQYLKENGDQILRIIIDTENGVDLDNCTEASRAIKDIIDESDVDYDHMEVSSPGIDRLLKREKDFVRFKGSKVKVKTFKSIDGQKNFIGILADTDDSFINLETEDGCIKIPRDMAASIRIQPDI